MEIKLLFLFKSVDGGTGTYLESLLDLKQMSNGTLLNNKVLVLDGPQYRSVKSNGYTFFSNKSTTYRRNHKKLPSIGLFLRELIWFVKNIKSYKPDIVISSNPHSILISEFGRYLFGLKFKTVNLIQNNLIEVFDYKLPFSLRSPMKKVLTYILNKSDMVTADSDNLSKDVANQFKLKTVPVTMPGVLPERYLNTKKIFCKHSKLIVTSIGRLDPQKDFETLLHAFQLVSREVDNVELWIVGDGPLKKNLVEMTKRLKIDKKSRFLGWVQNPMEILDQSDLFVFASKWEGFGLSLLEAMSRGVPVIASDCKYGPPEIIEKNKYGLLVPVGSISDMGEAIVSLLLNRTKRSYYSQMALKRSKYYSREKMLKTYNNVLISLLSS